MKKLNHVFITACPRSGLFIALLLVAMVACLNPPHDNDFDPDNPNKASVSGMVEGPDGAITHAIVSMMPDYDSTDVYIDTTDTDGRYGFEELDPGIYTIFVKAQHYQEFECYPESLPAETVDTIDVWMGGMLFTFDDESVGTQAPFGFDVYDGDWSVVDDQSAPSSPNAYECNTVYRGFSALRSGSEDFCLGADFKVAGPDSGMWQIGFIVRMQDSLNYYTVTVGRTMMHMEKWEGGNWLLVGYASVNVNTDTWYNLHVEACGTSFRVYLDCDMLIDIQDTSSFTGDVNGIFVAKELAQPITAHFDNVTFNQ